MWFRYPTIGMPDKMFWFILAHYKMFRYPTIGMPDKIDCSQSIVLKDVVLKKAQLAQACWAFFLLACCQKTLLSYHIAYR